MSGPLDGNGDAPRPIRELNPAVYPTGCAGRITDFSETEDGRFLITLTGVSRFRIKEELSLISGYRRVMAEWDDFAEPNESVVSSGVTLLDDFIRAHYRPVRTFGAITVLRAAEG